MPDGPISAKAAKLRAPRVGGSLVQDASSGLDSFIRGLVRDDEMRHRRAMEEASLSVEQEKAGASTLQAEASMLDAEARMEGVDVQREQVGITQQDFQTRRADALRDVRERARNEESYRSELKTIFGQNPEFVDGLSREAAKNMVDHLWETRMESIRLSVTQANRPDPYLGALDSMEESVRFRSQFLERENTGIRQELATVKDELMGQLSGLITGPETLPVMVDGRPTGKTFDPTDADNRDKLIAYVEVAAAEASADAAAREAEVKTQLDDLGRIMKQVTYSRLQALTRLSPDFRPAISPLADPTLSYGEGPPPDVAPGAERGSTPPPPRPTNLPDTLPGGNPVDSAPPGPPPTAPPDPRSNLQDTTKIVDGWRLHPRYGLQRPEGSTMPNVPLIPVPGSKEDSIYKQLQAAETLVRLSGNPAIFMNIIEDMDAHGMETDTILTAMGTSRGDMIQQAVEAEETIAQAMANPAPVLAPIPMGDAPGDTLPPPVSEQDQVRSALSRGSFVPGGEADVNIGNFSSLLTQAARGGGARELLDMANKLMAGGYTRQSLLAQAKSALELDKFLVPKKREAMLTFLEEQLPNRIR
jgi:hypothetical protein